MSFSLFTRKAAACGAVLLAAPALVLGQGYATNGVEYPIVGALPGDQVHPQASVSTTGGFLVWEDNNTDGYGLGVSAMRLDSGFSPVLAPFRVNQAGQGDQNRPQVSLLNDGGAAFVWQAGRQGYQHIFGRILTSSNIWAGNEFRISSPTNSYQLNPVMATLAGGNVLVAWASINQAATNSFQDVYAQRVSPSGQLLGPEFRVNQFTAYNQRQPAVAALSDGRFVIVWVSEQQSAVVDPGTTTSPVAGNASVDIYARIFNADGSAAGAEFMVNTASSLCSSPKVAAASDGTFFVVWTEQDRLNTVSGMDIVGRSFTSAGAGGAVRTVNTMRRGDQFNPAVSADATDYFVTWTSLGQDGSMEGVYGQMLLLNGNPDGGEFRVNTTWISQQIHPASASDGQGRFLAVWSGFTGGVNSFDVFAQRYVNESQPLLSMGAPFLYVPFSTVNGVYQPQIRVAWPMQAGLSYQYEVYLNGAATPFITTTTNVWLMTAADGLTANSSNSFQVAYVTASGRRSPLSPAASAKTWMGYSWGDSIPLEWVSGYYGWNAGLWPQPNQPVTGGGPTLLQVFLTGANPLDPSTWLRTRMVSTPEGRYLYWNPQPGMIYQVQTSDNLSGWTNYGGPRMAADKVDSVKLMGGNRAYFRVLRLR